MVLDLYLDLDHKRLFLRLRDWFSGGKCTSAASLKGKVAVVTGGNTGIGKETVLELVRRGARVIIGCRDVEKGRAVADRARTVLGGEVEVVALDLADLHSVRRFGEKCLEEGRVDLLVNNAGLMMPKAGAQTKQGFEVGMMSSPVKF